MNYSKQIAWALMVGLMRAKDQSFRSWQHGDHAAQDQSLRVD
jgi:hypothetical protein